MTTYLHEARKITEAYLECVQFTEEKEMYTFSDEALTQAHTDVIVFLDNCERASLDLSKLTAEQIGHDFWLTRNRHGAGFWDRGLGALGERLTHIAHSMGEVWVCESGRVLEFVS